jgi:hypothetical protein
MLMGFVRESAVVSPAAAANRQSWKKTLDARQANSALMKGKALSLMLLSTTQIGALKFILKEIIQLMKINLTFF